MTLRPGKDEIKKLQKTAILYTAHILCKILMYKYDIISTWETALLVP
jgi:hypothetical protein